MGSPEEFFGRVPRALDTVRPEKLAGPAYWRTAWGTRQTVAAIVLTLVLLPAYAAVAGWPEDPAVLTVLGVLSALGAIVGASYLPSPGTPAATSPCAAGPLFLLVGTFILLGRGPVTLGGVLFAGLLVVPALLLRAFGPTTCPS